MKTTIWIWGFLFILAAGCSQPQMNGSPRDEAAPLFRHRWWNYYARALSAADRKAFTAAEADLTAALRQRDGDQRMARTYGMHFIDYFPHRELGVVYWLQGDLAAAQRELEHSIRQHPSAKARFYLDQVRKALIQEGGGPIAPPQLTLSLPEEDLWTRDDPVRIIGRARDANYVSEILVNGTPLYLEGSEPVIDFSYDLSLPQGQHRVTVAAGNLTGRTRQQSFIVNVDRQGPTVVVDRIRYDDGRIIIDGSVLDMAGVNAITIDGKPLPLSSNTEIPFSHHMAEDQETVEIRCSDRLANETVVRLTPGQWADTIEQPKVVAGLHLAGLFGRRDRTPPVIQLDDWQDTQNVYMERIVFTGAVRDPGQVAMLSINGRAALPRKAAVVFFSEVVELREGANLIRLSARDTAGNPVERRIEIVRKVPEAKLLDHRLRLSIFAFAQKGEHATAAEAFQDSFIHQMVQGRRFQVVEREALDLLLQEQKISQTRLVDTPTAVNLGRLAAAQAIVIGSLIDTRTGIEIVARVVDSETSEILTTVDAYGEEKELSGLKRLAQTLSLKIHREFPLAGGMVIDREGPVIFTDLGEDLLRAQRNLLIYAEYPVHHPAGGQLLGFDQKVLGRARITQLQKQFSRAKLNNDADPAITIQNKVIPQ